MSSSSMAISSSSSRMRWARDFNATRVALTGSAASVVSGRQDAQVRLSCMRVSDRT
jgi:hypothetical protein